MRARARARARKLRAAGALVLIVLSLAVARARELRVCADPDDLPFSNERGEGFENRLAQIIAGDLHRTVRYSWVDHRGFVGSVLNGDECDVVMGVPNAAETVLTTRPYYRSTVGFVGRVDRGHWLGSLDHPALDDVTGVDVSLGVRRGDERLRDALDEVIARRAPEIDRLLAQYHVPRLRPGGAGVSAPRR